MNKRLLILGTLGEFEQLVQKARARGIYTIVCDGYPDGPARAFADESYVIPVTDTDRIAALCKEKQVDGILTSFRSSAGMYGEDFRKSRSSLLSEPGTASLVS